MLRNERTEVLYIWRHASWIAYFVMCKQWTGNLWFRSNLSLRKYRSLHTRWIEGWGNLRVGPDVVARRNTFVHIRNTATALTVIATASLFSAGTSLDNCDALGNDERDPLYIGSLFQDYIVSWVSNGPNGWWIINEIIFGYFCGTTTWTVGKKEPKRRWYEIYTLLNSPNYTNLKNWYHLNLRRRHDLLHSYKHNCSWQDSCVMHDHCPLPPPLPQGCFRKGRKILQI